MYKIPHLLPAAPQQNNFLFLPSILQVILALLGCACASPFLQFTPEVVAERARFQQLYNEAAALAAAAPDPVNSATHYQQAPVTSHHQQAPATYSPQWRGPVAATVPAGLPGSAPQVQDTADVQPPVEMLWIFSVIGCYIGNLKMKYICNKI